MSSREDAVAAARDAITETLMDWDTRRDWRFTQVVAPDIAIAPADGSFNLPTTFKKPYVAYLSVAKSPLFYVERANWHRLFPGDTSQSVPQWYTLFNEASTGQGQIFPFAAAVDTLNVLYYRAIIYSDSDEAMLDVPERWTGYILAGARARLIASKQVSEKALWWEKKYEEGLKLAKEDDLRIPDQFLSFAPPEAMNPAQYWNPNARWMLSESDGWGG